MSHFRIKNVFFTFVFSIFLIANSNAQIENTTSSNFWDNVQFGGGIGLGFGNGYFTGSISPIGVYRFNEYVSTGVGLNFTYADEKNFYNSFVVGGSVLGIFNPTPQIQLSTEFQQSKVNRNFDANVPFEDDNYWVSGLFLGAGYTTGNVTVGIQYDVLYDRDKSIYGDAWFPFVRVLF